MSKHLKTTLDFDPMLTDVASATPPSSQHGALNKSIRQKQRDDISEFKKDPLYSDIILCQLSSCAKLVSICCSRCKSAFYCSEEHRKKHWQIEGHMNTCIPHKAYDPYLDPIPGTFGPESSAPDDLWNPDKASVCFDLKVHMDKWQSVYGGENKLFLVKAIFGLNLKDTTPDMLTLHDKESGVQVLLRPTNDPECGFKKVMKHFTSEWTNKKKVCFRARRHGDFLRVYYDEPIADSSF